MRKRLLGILLVALSLIGAARAQEGEVIVDDPPTQRFSFSAEYLFWWVKNGPTPGPMVTTGPVSKTPGNIGGPGVTVLYGDDGINYKLHSGGRFDLTGWLNRAGTVGFDLGGFFLETHTTHFELNSDKFGDPVIARPFINVLTGQEDAQVLTLPGAMFGGIDIFSDSRLWGADGNLVLNLLRGERGRLDLLTGFRYLGIDESLRISQSTTLFVDTVPLASPPFFNGSAVLGTQILSLTDRFETRNEFFGGQVGLHGVLRRGRWLADATLKLGIGDTKQWVNNMGVTDITGSSGPIAANQAGLYAVGDNRGLHSRDRFSFVSETGCRLGVDFLRHFTAYVGYTFLYWDSIARPGEQMNRTINPQLVPSNIAFGPVTAPAEPALRFASSPYWAMGVSLGLAVRY